MINDNLNAFCGKQVLDFDPQEPLKDLNQYVYRIRIDYEAYENDERVEALIRTFAEIPAVADCRELIIGAWDFESSTDASSIVNVLVAVKDAFQNLKSLFIGDIISEETEISWIQQSNLSPLLAAFPKLELFQARGGEGLSLPQLKHDNLKTLILQTGGLPPNVVQDLSNADLPNLEKLEVWLGEENYGFNSKIEDFDVLLNGGKFPKLTYLGLKNSILQDEIAIAVVNSKVINQLHTLDLSMGILSDIGAEALLNSPAVKKLRLLDLDHHYMSDEMMAKLGSLGISVSMNEQEAADEDGDRYIEVSE